MQSRENQLYFSAASSWEISIKAGLGKLPLPEAPDKYISSRMVNLRVIPLDIKHYHTFMVYKLPLHHRDPFDHILLATAIAENIYLMTTDQQLRRYEVNIIWGFD